VIINSVHTNNNDLLSPSAKVFSAKMSGWVDLSKLSTTKVLCYAVSMHFSKFYCTNVYPKVGFRDAYIIFGCHF